MKFADSVKQRYIHLFQRPVEAPFHLFEKRATHRVTLHVALYAMYHVMIKQPHKLPCNTKSSFLFLHNLSLTHYFHRKKLLS